METSTPTRKSFLQLLRASDKAKNFDQMLVDVQDALKAFPGDKKLLKWLHYAQVHYVNEKLESHVVHELEAKKDFAALELVYQKLLQIFPGSPLLLQKLKEARVKMNKEDSNRQQEALVDAHRKVDEFLKTDQVEDAMNAVFELLSFNPADKEAHKLLEKVKNLRDKKLSVDMLEYFKSNQAPLREDYKKNKKAFIRV